MSCAALADRLLLRGRRRHRPVRIRPDAKTPCKGVRVAPQAHVHRQFPQTARITAAENDVVDLKCSAEALTDIRNGTPPLLVSEPLQSALAGVILVSPSLLVWQMRKLSRLHHTVDDERRAKAGAQSKKEHPASLIASDGLHGRIVDDADGAAECAAVLKPHPAAAEVVRLRDRPAVQHDAGKSQRNRLVPPTPG